MEVSAVLLITRKRKALFSEDYDSLACVSYFSVTTEVSYSVQETIKSKQLYLSNSRVHLPIIKFICPFHGFHPHSYTLRH